MAPTAYLILESNIYNFASKYIKDYDGGSWNFEEIEDVWYAYPHIGECVLFNPNNYFEETVDEKIAGLAITMYTYNQLAWHYHGTNNVLCEFFIDRYYTLREHCNSAEIFRFLD
ncbi:antirestriction protein [Aliivibrio sp. S4TY2]|nr:MULTISPECIES: antirestriction protein [unclassified Aliivibrio]MDD9156409.1 antirestriction protein [Aliivibrio sp. S4TY2]MDD9162339.1 antirestriction protein [Aliivibrio sp. S4TY1]MDD9164117.1 antirestriction protein [Aliivibrio sp. S4MY2]MDD9167910.1 antirestriction protein [Aliivibrio sp. S4MY4]MDD9187425.1 antirestriction protein [Aliivibrio sp. S4MY3]